MEAIKPGSTLESRSDSSVEENIYDTVSDPMDEKNEAQTKTLTNPMSDSSTPRFSVVKTVNQIGDIVKQFEEIDTTTQNGECTFQATTKTLIIVMIPLGAQQSFKAKTDSSGEQENFYDDIKENTPKSSNESYLETKVEPKSMLRQFKRTQFNARPQSLHLEYESDSRDSEGHGRQRVDSDTHEKQKDMLGELA